MKIISSQEAERMAADLLALEFQRVAPTQTLHQAALHRAERIGQSKVYDAQYVALQRVFQPSSVRSANAYSILFKVWVSGGFTPYKLIA